MLHTTGDGMLRVVPSTLSMQPPHVFDIIENHARHTENACNYPQRAITLGLKSSMADNIIKNHMAGACNHDQLLSGWPRKRNNLLKYGSRLPYLNRLLVMLELHYLINQTDIYRSNLFLLAMPDILFPDIDHTNLVQPVWMAFKRCIQSGHPQFFLICLQE